MPNFYREYGGTLDVDILQSNMSLEIDNNFRNYRDIKIKRMFRIMKQKANEFLNQKRKGAA